uniref:Uncharacterized protein n=1 Tax=Panagrolaimus sp. JU765 TaxID=591449 RepID=A0AC34R360_9BILA
MWLWFWFWYSVRFIIEEEYWNYEVVGGQNVESDIIYEKRRYSDFEKAKKYLEEMFENVKKNNFGEKVGFRLRKVPEGFLDDPDEWLKIGTHLQRNVTENELSGIGTLEGIYMGNGQVAYTSIDDRFSLDGEPRAYPRIDTLENFLGDPNNELRIVVS